jgi:PAS domain S-box-containing protein
MSSDADLSILIVDDSAFFVSLLSDKLESNYGMTTLTATSAAEAVATIGNEPVDCIVSDYEMPENNGLDLYEMVDERHDIPFILLTSRGDEEVASRAIRMGIDEYLLKQAIREEEPLELLVNRIENVVEQRRTQRKYEQLIDNSPDEITQLGADGTILAANEAMATSVGVPQAEVVGRQLSEFLPEDVAAGRIEEGERAITAGSAVTFQDSIGVRHFHNIAVPLSMSGEGESVQLVTREITLQKRNEQELERKSETLTLINRIVRHDINNDVQLLMAWADHLEDHVDEEGQEFVDRIDDTSDHIVELTSIARDFVESIESESGPDLEPVDIGRVLETEIEKKRATFGEATIEVGDLPWIIVRANELLSSVFGNLLNNAVRHNQSDDPKVYVDVTEIENDVRVRVADNGPGVPDDHKEMIFGKGRMGPESPGTGVGLYLVHMLVQQYGGEVWVEDREAWSPPGDQSGTADSEAATDDSSSWLQADDATGAVFVVELPKHPEQSQRYD